MHILPFLGETALFKQFHLDKPWDSAHNKKLISQMPAVYLCPTLKGKDSGLTSYLAPVGEATTFRAARVLR